jgi:hypothetical protein
MISESRRRGSEYCLSNTLFYLNARELCLIVNSELFNGVWANILRVYQTMLAAKAEWQKFHKFPGCLCLTNASQ